MAAKKLETEIDQPRPTVREAMRSVLASAKLVAGADGLDRQVEWVRLMETPEVQPRAGDLMFTSGFPIKDDPDAQIRLVGRIAEGGGAGLVVRPLPYLHRKETILRQGTPHRVLFDPQIQRTLREVEAKRGPVKVPAFPHLGMSRERLIAPIFAANQVLGYISILDHPPHNEELAFMAIEQAAPVLALSIAKERELSEVEGRVRGEVLEDLLHGTYGDEAAAQRRARHVGYPLQGSHIVVLVDIDDFRGFTRARQISEDAIQALKRDFLRRVTAVVRSSYQRALVQGRSDQVVALLPLGTEVGDHQARSHALGLQIQQAISEWKPGFTVSVGFSAPIEAPSAVEGALREVTSVMESLARFKRWGQVVAVPDLGLTGLLAAVSDERLVDYSRRHLGPLVEHDAARKSALVATLRAYLETGQQQHAAQRLRVHPNTLRYRLDRIREITGLNLEDPETRLNLSVALRVQSLLGM